MAQIQKTVSPVDGRIYVERPLADDTAIARAQATAWTAQTRWRQVPVRERVALVNKAIDAFVAQHDKIAEEITWQMGRPIAQSPGEVRGLEERARYMASIAEQALAPVDPGAKPGFNRFIRREPVGVVFTIAPWNYPYLTAVNSVVPAILAGNAVILKHSAQTPLCAERFGEAFAAAGLPAGVFQHLHLSHASTLKLIESQDVDFVCFTGSVDGGHAVQQAASRRFIGAGLELGGKDPAYVRADANFDHAVENLVDGAFFNSGQSCCGIERIYVDARIYDRFVEAYAALTRKYVLGNPTDKATNLGPMVRASAAEAVRKQIAEAKTRGARGLIDEKLFAASKLGTPYLAPEVLIGVDHTMEVMTEESFGPVVGIMPVKSEDEAVSLMNDSAYGLTAAIWTSDEQAAQRIGDRIETGTVFMNRCDYLDPALAWTGVKDSGRGCTLSRVGFEHLTRPKSFHLRTSI
ncbi:MAG: aldehyde dehydrogenase family protein [Alphaproteobacteria bacterium]|nr:aldehyde dehydrogenase family protein [Alphaproteobacteria bacterium]